MLDLDAQLKLLRDEFQEFGQEHVFRFSEQLNDEDKKALLDDLKSIDLKKLKENFELVTKHSATPLSPEPFPAVTRGNGGNQTLHWKEIGTKFISEGKLAVLLLAGGQGTRLGTTNPKGMYDIGLPSKKTLFQLQAERLYKLKLDISKHTNKQKVQIPWYIMTSEATGEITKEFFKLHNYFGLDPADIFFFEQDMIPCLTPEGKIIMHSKSKVSRAPNGNGGVYVALKNSGALDDMGRRGVHLVYQYCVDNSLVKMADPVFVGFCTEKGADCAAKVVPKANPDEKVGVVCLKNNQPAVMEYSEIDPEVSRSVDPKTGILRFNAAHICMNMFSVPFLNRIVNEYLEKIPYHVAKKKIPCVNDQGETETPQENNGWKLELFIFDVFCLAERMVAFEVVREEEFSPLKNAPGTPDDSPDTCRQHLSSLHKKYLKRAGGSCTPTDGLFEISPLLSLEGEGITDLVQGKTFALPCELK